ncbi:MAG: hypothetical protein JWN89_92 [Parcubacteria group bacterium]|nr:hypothetical protein [Parcubacteria group bacterium]
MKSPFNKVFYIFACLLLIFSNVSLASAAALTSFSDTMSRQTISTNSSHVLKFTTPTGVAISQTVKYTFPTGFNFTSSTFANVTISWGTTTGLENSTTTASSNSATAWGAAFSGSNNVVLTLTAPSGAGNNIPAGKIMIVTIASTNSVNPSGATTYSIGVIGSFGDTGTTTVNIIGDDTVAVSGTVPQAITFAISANTIGFGTLDSGAARYANTTTGSASDVVAHTLAVSTNAPTGYTITVQGATLTSQQNVANTITAIGASPATSSTGNEQFGIYASKAGGTNGTIASPYVTVSSFGYNATAGSAATFASGTSATATETYSLHYLANIAPTTEAGTYAASLVYVATANF